MRAILGGRDRRPDKEHIFGRSHDRPFTGWSESKAALDARLKAAGHKLKPWVNHDLRRTIATGMGELEIAPHVIEAVLNHASGFRAGVAGIYNRAKLEKPMRHALEAWGAHIEEIVEGRIAGDRSCRCVPEIHQRAGRRPDFGRLSRTGPRRARALGQPRHGAGLGQAKAREGPCAAAAERRLMRPAEASQAGGRRANDREHRATERRGWLQRESAVTPTITRLGMTPGRPFADRDLPG